MIATSRPAPNVMSTVMIAKPKFQAVIPRSGPERAGSVNVSREVVEPDAHQPALGQRVAGRLVDEESP